MVRCGQDRSATRYDAECMNARDAVGRIAAASEQARREELEAQSEQKRQALRRARQAAEEMRRRAQEAEQRRKEAEYYGEFEPLPPGDEASEYPDASRPEPIDSDVGTLPEPSVEGSPAGLPVSDGLPPEPDARTGSGADVGDASPEEVREELRRRQVGDQGQ